LLATAIPAELAEPIIDRAKMFGGIIGDLTGHKGARLKGSVVLMRKTVLNLDVTSIGATVLDNVTELLGRGVTCQLISSTVTDPSESGLLFVFLAG
jgi:hypothetical protein